MNPILGGWRQYKKSVLSDNLSSSRLFESKCDFYAGAQYVFVKITKAAEKAVNNPTTADFSLMERMAYDIAKFAERFRFQLEHSEKEGLELVRSRREKLQAIAKYLEGLDNPSDAEFLMEIADVIK